MFSLNGFCKISSFSNNQAGIVSGVGELSQESMSYTKDKRYYRGKATDTELVVFDSTRDESDVEPPIEHINTISLVCQYIFESAIGDSFTESEEAARGLITSEFSSKIRNLSVGTMMNERGSWFPSWISFILENSEENKITVWFANDVFEYQYMGYTIVPVSPLDQLDIFQQTKPSVLKALEDFTIPKHHEKVKQLSDNIPYTQLISYDYTWHDREDSESTASTTWSVLVYGAAGANPTRIKRALQEYILANSTYSRADWIKVFPEIFTSTEFTFLPYWELTTGLNETNQGAAYSPLVPYEKFVEKSNWFFETVEDLGSDGINNRDGRYLAFVPIHFKSLAATAVAGADNPDGKKTLFEIFPDYPIMPPSSVDTSRLDEKTTVFIRKLIECMGYAEGLYNFNVIDHNFSVVEVNNIKFYAFEYENVEYRVLMHPSRQEQVEG
jgi:hypothetical protein